MKSLYTLIVFFLLVLLYGCKPKDQGKHLFILSGQSNMVGLNIKETFVPTLQAKFGKDNIIVVKDAMGAQPIRRWYKDWKTPSGDIPKISGDLYDRLMLKVNDSINNQNIASATFIWMQGERDARMKFGDVYETSLIGLYNQLSKDLNRTDVNFIIGRLSDFDMTNQKWPHWTKVRDAQIKVGESKPNFGWINTDDLNDGVNKKGDSIVNDLHMSVDGYKTMGKRFANKSIELINN